MSEGDTRACRDRGLGVLGMAVIGGRERAVGVGVVVEGREEGTVVLREEGTVGRRSL